MAISTSRVFGALALIIASGFVLTPITSTSAAGAEDPCFTYNASCKECLDLKSHPNVTNCTYYYSDSNNRCSATPPAVERVTPVNVSTECKDDPPTPPTTPAPANTTTVPTTTTSTSTTVAPSTNGTTVPTTTAPPPTNGTTVPTTTGPTTTAAPSNSTTTTTAPPTTAAPSHGGGGMSWTSFFGGIVFTAAISAVAYLVWRFYRARQERNYHTLTTNLI